MSASTANAPERAPAAARSRWMAVLARADADELAAAIAALAPPAPAYRRVRGPETGLVMLRAGWTR